MGYVSKFRIFSVPEMVMSRDFNEREQLVICAYFGIEGKAPKTRKEIARDLGVSITSVGDARNKALWKLKQSTRGENLREYL